MTETVRDKAIDMAVLADFKNVYVNYFAPLCFFASKYLEGHEEDIVNALFVKLWNNGTHFSSDDHCRNYLYKAVYHACLDEMQLLQNAKVREEQFVKGLADKDSTVEELIIETEYWANIHREINRLPQNYASVMKLSYMDGFSNQEVAQELSLSVQTVKNQKSKGLKLLRAALLKQTLSLFLFLKLFF